MVAEFQDMWEDKFRKASLLLTLLFTTGIGITIYLFPPWIYPEKVEVDPRLEIIPVDLQTINAGGNEGSDGGSPNDTPYEKPISENVTPTNNTTSTQHVTTNPNSNVSVPTGNSNTPTVNQNALFTKPTGNGTGTGTGDGDGPGTGEGDGPGNGTTSGNGNGPGHGNYNLAGRNLESKVEPKNVSLKEGKIVINIWVGKDGKVTRTKVNLDLSTINDSKLAAECEKAAMKTKWYEDEEADEEQKGSITYNFKLN